MSNVTTEGAVINIKASIHGPYTYADKRPDKFYFCSYLRMEVSSGDEFNISYPTPEALIFFCQAHGIEIEDSRSEKPRELKHE